MSQAQGSLSTILNPDGLSVVKLKQKSVRSNDRLFKYEVDANLDKTQEVLKSIDASAELYGDNEKGKSETSDDNYRHDTVRDINWGMTIVANSIKVVSAVLTILAVDQTERNDDEYDKAIGTLLSIGASVLKVAGEKMLDFYNSNSNQPSSVNKLGLAAPTSDFLDLKLSEESPEELLRKQKVEEFVSKLTPEQLKIQQTRVQEHVTKQAIEQNLNEAQTALLLSQTLEYNGLPQINASPNKIGLASSNGDQSGSFLPSIDSLIGGIKDLVSPGPGFDTVNRLGEVADDTEDDGSGLPKPGTLQHTFTLGVFRLQQALNQLVSSPDSFLADGISLFSGQPAADNKIGQAAGTSPVSYSSITSLSPTNVALGVLATGALGSVVYSALTSNNIATGAASLADGAVSAIRRNDLVVAASDMFGIQEKYEDNDNQQMWVYDYYSDYDADYRYNGVHAHSAQYPNMDYREYPGGRHYYQTLFSGQSDQDSEESNMETIQTGSGYQPHSQPPSVDHSNNNIRPVYQPSPDSSEAQERKDKLFGLDVAQEPITAGDGFYKDLNSPTPSPEIPYIVYSNEENPWTVMDEGFETNHLYKRSGNPGDGLGL